MVQITFDFLGEDKENIYEVVAGLVTSVKVMLLMAGPENKEHSKKTFIKILKVNKFEN